VHKRIKIRWAVLCGAFLITTIASFYPLEQAGDVGTSNAPVSPAKRAILGAALPVAANASAPVQGAVAVDNDPFAPRGWVAAPVPEPEPTQVVTVNAVVDATPSVPVLPPLPFKFTGQLTDDGQQVVYLSRGDQILLAHLGDTLDSAYKVTAITAQQIEFEYLPSGEKQTLALPATDH